MENEKHICSVCKGTFDAKYFDLEQEKCILHCEKTEKNGWYTINTDGQKEWTKKLKIFWSYIKMKLDECYRSYLWGDYDLQHSWEYVDVIFPKFEEEEDRNSYENNIDEMGTNFFSVGEFEHPDRRLDYEVNQIFNRLNIIFKNCTFLDIANFEKYHRTNYTIFNQCHFKETILLSKTQKSELHFYECNFYNKELSLRETVFEDIFMLKDCISIGLFDVSDSHFKAFANFMGSSFQKADFNETFFSDTAVFIDTTFEQSIDFRYTTFSKLALFRDSVFKNTLNLRDTMFKDEVNFLGLQAKMANRETARIIKNSLEKQKNLIESNKYHALELREKSKELSPFTNLSEWLLFKIHWISSNHSQSYILALFWIIIIGILGIDNNVISSLNSFIISEHKLDDIANSLNNILNIHSKTFTMYQLFLKISLAYLIYQFIVSVRQNTRRK